MAYMSDLPHDRYTQLHECRRDLEFELPTAKVTVDRSHVVIRLPHHDAVDLLRRIEASS